MNFDLHKPCATCPFRCSAPSGWLGEKRAENIASILLGGNTFQCHNTLDKAPGQHCAGALIILKKEQGGFSGALSYACFMEWLDHRALDLSAPVFDSFEQFIAHHTIEEEPS